MESPKLNPRLSLVTEQENVGDDCADIQAIDVDPNAVSDLEFRLKVSRELLVLGRAIERQRHVLNRMLTRFATDGRPLPGDQEVA